MTTGLFVCDRCGTVDSVELAMDSAPPKPGQPWECTCCQGEEWHNHFPRETYNPQQDLVINRPTGIGLA